MISTRNKWAIGCLLLASFSIHITSSQEGQAAQTPSPTPNATEPNNPTLAVTENKVENKENGTTKGQDYCDPSLCKEGLIHVACNQSLELHHTCSLDAEVLDINEKLQKFLVDRFNELRDSVAKGGYNGLSPAARMGTLKWDPELSHLAEFNVQNCFLKNDECRNTKTSSNAGQIVGYRAVKGNIPELEDRLKDITGLWMRESTGISMLDIMKYKHPQAGSPKYNFVQIVLEDAELVGCAILQQTQNHWLQTHFTCNFGNAPVVGATVYENSPQAGKSCKTGMNPKHVHLCSASETYEKIAPKVENSSNATVNARTVKKVGIQRRDGGAVTPAADGAVTPAAEGAVTPAAEGAVTPAAEGATPVPGGNTTALSPGNEAPGATPGGNDTAIVDGLLEPIPTPPPKDALLKKFARFLMLMEEAKLHNGRRKIVIITSNHEVDDNRMEAIPDPDLDSAMQRSLRSRRHKLQRSRLRGRTMRQGFLGHARSRPGRSHHRVFYPAPEWIVVS